MSRTYYAGTTIRLPFEVTDFDDNPVTPITYRAWANVRTFGQERRSFTVPASVDDGKLVVTFTPDRGGEWHVSVEVTNPVTATYERLIDVRSLAPRP